MTEQVPSKELVSVILQRPGQIPERKGPYLHSQIEAAVREMYSLYPGAVVIVMPGLPEDCWPQHGHEFLDILDAERCWCEVDEPPHPKCPVDHSRRAAHEPPGAHNEDADYLEQHAADCPRHTRKSILEIAARIRAAQPPGEDPKEIDRLRFALHRVRAICETNGDRHAAGICTAALLPTLTKEGGQ